jgi:hypothetical protein
MVAMAPGRQGDAGKAQEAGRVNTDQPPWQRVQGLAVGALAHNTGKIRLVSAANSKDISAHEPTEHAAKPWPTGNTTEFFFSVQAECCTAWDQVHMHGSCLLKIILSSQRFDDLKTMFWKSSHDKKNIHVSRGQ